MNGKSILLMSALLFAFSSATASDDGPAPKDWPAEMRTVKYLSPVDNSHQPAVIYVPETDEPVPLLVTLHTWSGNYAQKADARAKWCIDKKWALIAPDFRGPNWTPQACGSERAVADIVAAVEHMKKRTKIDESRIYLVGSSGGGHMALQMAGRHPEIWAGVSSWVGIFDLKDWHEETARKKLPYAKHIEQSCGGPPGMNAEVDRQYRLRSPSAWLQAAKNVPLDINHGIHDGHTGSVPVSHGIKAFNLLAEPAKRLSPEDIQYFCTQRKVPEKLQSEKENDPLYGGLSVLFRRISGNTRLTIFDGGHQDSDQAALNWLSQQRKGKPAEWKVGGASGTAPQSSEVAK